MPATITDRRDGLTTSVAVKAPCLAVASSNITLSGLQTVSSVVLVAGDRVLLIAQTDPVENGIYVADTGDWSRSRDFDGALDAVSGTLVVVRNALISGALYQLTSDNPIIFDTSEITFELLDDPSITYSITQTEIDVGVTPFSTSYEEGDDRRYVSLSDWCKVVSAGVVGKVYTDHNVATPLALTGTALIIVFGQRALTATASITHMLSTSAQLTVIALGEWLFDGDLKVSVGCLHCTTTLPRLKNVRFLDAVGAIITGAALSTSVPLYGAVGDGELDNVTAENCTDIGFQIWGNSQTLASQTATLTVKDCKTLGTTGSGTFGGAGAGYLHHFAGLRSVRILGGYWRGASTALLTSAYKCSTSEVQGGTYDGISRGPTIGEESVNFVVNGTVCRNMAGNAVSADTTTGVGSIPGIGVLSNNTANACGRAIRTTCSNVSVIGNKAYECTSAGAAFVFAGAGSDVYVDGNSDYSATLGRVSYYVLEASTVTFGSNQTNSTARTAYLTASDSLALMNGNPGVVRTMTASGDLTGNDRIIVVDATAGTVDIDLFDNTEVRMTGKEVTIIKQDTANACTITFQGGAVHGETVNGASSLSIPAAQRAHLRLICTNGATGTWHANRLPQAIYTVTNPTTDRTYDADAAAVTETNDVLATLLSDLGLR